MTTAGFKFVYDISVSAAAVLVNGFILTSVWRASFEPHGYRRFLICLAISDLFIGSVNVGFLVHQSRLMQMYDEGAFRLWDLQYVFRNLQLTGFLANLLSLVAMSCDHFIGIIYPLHYNKYLRARTCKIIIGAIWLTAFVIGLCDIVINSVAHARQLQCSTDMSKFGEYDLAIVLSELDSEQPSQSDEYFTGESFPESFLVENATMLPNVTLNSTGNHFSGGFFHAENVNGNASQFVGQVSNDESGLSAELRSRLAKMMEMYKRNRTTTTEGCPDRKTPKRYTLEFAVIALTVICLGFLVICYGRVFKEVFQNQPSIRSLRKLVLTTCLLLGTFVICWLPFMSFEFFMYFLVSKGETSPNKQVYLSLNDVFHSMLMSAPLLDPLIYSARLRTIQRYILLRLACILPCWDHLIRLGVMTRNSIQTALSINSIKRLFAANDNLPASKSFDVHLDEGFIDGEEGDAISVIEPQVSSRRISSFDVAIVGSKVMDSEELPPAIYRKCSRFMVMVDELHSLQSFANAYNHRNAVYHQRSFRRPRPLDNNL